jgi:serine/threonine protein kinase
LRRRCRRARALDVASSLLIGVQLARSLVVAHQRRVIHRDIKPENLLLEPEGVLKVMDFGIARLAQPLSAVTTSGLLVGTPAYMAPEQLVDESVDFRADVYATGVVLYECLTGRLPYAATSVLALVAAIVQGKAAPPIELNASISQALSSLIMRMMHPDVAHRPRSAAEVVQLLEQLS